jgi:hypothetical protein
MISGVKSATHGSVRLGRTVQAQGRRSPDEGPFVYLKLPTGPLNIDEPDQVGTYQQAFANLFGASAEGEHARTLLARVGEDMRRR